MRSARGEGVAAFGEAVEEKSEAGGSKRLMGLTIVD
jgi:hypothetical protein